MTPLWQSYNYSDGENYSELIASHFVAANSTGLGVYDVHCTQIPAEIPTTNGF